MDSGNSIPSWGEIGSEWQLGEGKSTFSRTLVTGMSPVIQRMTYPHVCMFVWEAQIGHVELKENKKEDRKISREMEGEK